MFFISNTIQAQEPLPIPTKQDTLNGSITAEREWWDIMHYSIAIKPDYVNKTISGLNTIAYRVVKKTHTGLMQIDLVKPLMIDSAFANGEKLSYTNSGNIWYVKMPQKLQAKNNKVIIYYSGKVVESVKPPWDGGMVWSKDSLGRPWIGVACQYKGASLWYPCKNALYDEPDKGASITVTVPDTLIAVGNGLLQKKQQNSDRTTTYTWAVQNPVNHYGISFYIGKYVNISRSYKGSKGSLSTNYWLLDYHVSKGESHMIPEVNTTLKSLERWFGPYPFYKDGYKIVEAPYVAMEHQSAIAYGRTFKKGTNSFGDDISNTGWGKKTDRTIVHETAHEWFGNNITAADIADRWIQEGFAGLAEELVIADLCGKQAGAEFLAGRYRTIKNDKPVIARYGINEDGSHDNYVKGWAILHMVQTIINNDVLFIEILQGLNKKFKNSTVTTSDIEDYISTKSSINFKPLFNQYLRTAQVPVLEYKIIGDTLLYRFNNCINSFTIPVKTNVTKHTWLYPTTTWQNQNIPNIKATDSLKANIDFYITVSRVQ